MRIQAVKHVLWARDMDRAVAFWRDVFGLRLVMQSEWWSELAWGDATVALHGGGTGEVRESGLGFEVADLDEACREVEAGGGRVRRPPEDRPGEPIRLAEAVDPEGNAFQLSQRVP